MLLVCAAAPAVQHAAPSLPNLPRQCVALAVAALLLPSTVHAQSSCVAPSGQCGSNAGFQCCTSGNYCQPWNDNFYQCVPVPSGCDTLETDTDYDGTDVKAYFGVTLPADCCKLCTDEPQCEFFTFVNSWGPACYLKKGMGTKRVFKGSVVGRKTVAATAVPSTCGSAESNTDYYGNDLRSVDNVDLAGCCSACNNDANCQVYSYVASTRGCYLKTSSAGRKAAAGVTSGTKKASSTVPSPSTCASGLEGETDYYGADLRTVNNVDLAGCCSACTNDASCKFFTHVAASLSCYLKTSDAGRKYGAGAVSGKKLAAVPPPTTPAPTTPAPTQAPSTCPGQESNIDYYGNDLRSVNNVDLAACCSACNNDANCKVYTYVPATSSCYLKTSAAGRRAGTGAVSGKKAVTVPSTCGASVDADVDYYGNDIRSVNGVDLAGCCSACNNDANCGAYTYWGSSQTCYLKTKSGGSVVAVGAVSGKKVASTPTSCAAGIETDVDYYGNDLRSVTGVDLGGCCSACNNDPSCNVYTYVASSQSCYLKTKNTGRVVSVGAVSGVKRVTAAGDWDTSRCGSKKLNVYYHGNDIAGSEKAFDTLGECCDHCRANANCKLFTYFRRGSKKRCLLKTGTQGAEKTRYDDRDGLYVASGAFA